MKTLSTITFLTIVMIGFSQPSRAQIRVTPQDATVYPTQTCYVIIDDGTRSWCNGLGITVGNFSINYHFAVYDYSQQNLSPLVAVAFGVPKKNPSSVLGILIYTADGLSLSLPATGRCQRTSQEITCNAVTSHGDKFVGRATQ